MIRHQITIMKLFFGTLNIQPIRIKFNKKINLPQENEYGSETDEAMMLKDI